VFSYNHKQPTTFSGTTSYTVVPLPTMASKIETRNVSSGFQAILFSGCEIDSNGKINTATADNISKTWGVTESDARNQLTR